MYRDLLFVRFMSCLVVLPSISKPPSSQSAYRQRNQYPDGHLLASIRAIRRSLTPLLHSLSLPPVSTMVMLRLAIWYAPLRFLGNLSTTVLVYLFQVVHCGIVNLLRTASLQLCYNSIVGLGGFEPPRQLASSCQDYHGCQLRHSPSAENLVEGSPPSPPSTESPCKRHYHNLYLLSSFVCWCFVSNCGIVCWPGEKYGKAY